MVSSLLAHGNTSIQPLALLSALAFDLAVGLFFGIWTARRAAGLDPTLDWRDE